MPPTVLLASSSRASLDLYRNCCGRHRTVSLLRHCPDCPRSFVIVAHSTRWSRHCSRLAVLTGEERKEEDRG
uniref:Uncharacterized protein n=1 Tax=Oryza meridionalis TaxID=40149 RepID=A0A0E0EQQ0_9ORYZ